MATEPLPPADSGLASNELIIGPVFPDNRPKIVPPKFIRAEANLLRWPIFSLATKTLKERRSDRCEGMKREGNREHRFSLVVSRNSRYLYPDPLARKVHMALQSILVERGYPYQNPIEFTWRELARRMGISINGAKIARMNDALFAALALLAPRGKMGTIGLGTR